MSDAGERPPIHMGAVMRCRCPRCLEGHLFTQAIRSVDACRDCQLDLSRQDAGDGPAFFAITIVGTIVTLLAAVVEMKLSPPFWLHALLWVPLILVLSLGLLRIAKSYLIHLEYQLALLKGRDD